MDMPCKCESVINTLTQRITRLEEQLRSILTKQNQHTTTINSQLAEPHHSATSTFTHSQSSVMEQPTSANLDISKADHDGKMYVDLVPGYEARITIPQLDSCLRKAKESGTALARLLANVFFDERTLAQSSVRGTKRKPALDSDIISAIIKYVWEKRKCSEKEVVQAINQKCADARTSSHTSCKKQS